MTKFIALVLSLGVAASCAPEHSALPQPKTALDLLTCEAMNGMAVHLDRCGPHLGRCEVWGA